MFIKKMRVSAENSHINQENYNTLMGIYKNSQKGEVLRYLKNHNGITSMEAFSELGITRLSDVIYRLKKDGVVFGKEQVQYKAKNGRIVNYDRYILLEV